MERVFRMSNFVYILFSRIDNNYDWFIEGIFDSRSKAHTKMIILYGSHPHLKFKIIPHDVE
jgi:hypothetical protein